MNHFCHNCQKNTEDSTQQEFTPDFSSTKRLMVVTCEDCGTFKFQYLEDMEE